MGCGLRRSVGFESGRVRVGVGVGVQGLVLVGEFDENVFEGGSERANFADVNVFGDELFAKGFGSVTIVNEGVNGLAENGCAANAVDGASGAEGAGDFGSGDFHAISAGRLNIGKQAERIGRAVGDEFAVINVGDVTAAFGFVHIVGGDEESDALAGELEEKIPELAASDGVDAGGGLVEEN